MGAKLRSTFPSGSCRVLGVEGARGEFVVPNDELTEALGSSDEWIQRHTGIVTRRHAAALRPFGTALAEYH